MKEYDYLVVGAGIYGATFANLMHNKGKKVLVIDKNPHIGGNVYDEKIEGIWVHKYGAHIFHTNDKKVWDYVNQFTSFNDYRHTVIAKNHNHLYSMPFNMYTFEKIYGEYASTPENAKAIIDCEKIEYGKKNPQNLEEQAISLVGFNVYNILIKDYTEKQWHRKCTDLPPEIIKRLPIRWTFDNRYFNDKYQGLPINGYTNMVSKMLKDIEVRLETDFLSNREYYMSIADKIIYTGPIDEFFDYKLGELEYRGLDFVITKKRTNNYQGASVINLCDKSDVYTRTIEFKHFYGYDDLPYTYIMREYPVDWQKGMTPYYPINNDRNNTLYQSYIDYAKEYTPNILFKGRLGSYKYYDMDDAVADAMQLVETLK